jgi:outer membrane protein OmpA-like peptidoglycan-associated protein
MKEKLLISLLLLTGLSGSLFAQQDTYTVKKASFSSDEYDEFSPVFYKNGVVFCTNRNTNLANYSTAQGKGLFKINYIDTAGKSNWQSARLLSKELTTKLNDGPVTFNSTGDTIYFARNLDVSGNLKDISGKRNKIGLFGAILVGGKWTKIRELRFNNEWYNVITPWLSSDGKRLFFASDKPGGLGGFDLYYSTWKGDYWGDPVNLGPVINTPGNEGYPFINPSGELFFSSDGHRGLGGKDIYFSRFSGNDWLPPVRLDAPINSEFDDFGIVTDSLIAEGYFSSSRNKTVDIFHFRTNFPQIFYTNIQKENQYCFMFSDSGAIEVDTLKVKYVWDFGDGKKASGASVKHCFAGPGNYNVKLDIIDRASGKLFFSKLSCNVELKNFEQPYINSPEVALTGEMINFDGLKSNNPGYKVLSYSWDFGDGNRLQGESVRHAFNQKGEYKVNLGLTLKSDLNGNIHKTGVTKIISVYGLQSEKESGASTKAGSGVKFPDFKKPGNLILKPVFSAESEFKGDAIFTVEIAESASRIDLNSSVFSKVPKKYTVEEIFDQKSGSFRYIIDRQISLMATYMAFREISGYGFRDAKTRIDVLTDPAEKELNNLKKIFGIQADIYFDRNNKLTSTAYLLLDQIYKLMIKYPAIKLEIGVHTDNSGLPDSKIALSQYYSQVIANYLTGKGIDRIRLVQKGYGATRPVASNATERDRMLNRRVEFTKIRE